MTTSMPLQGLRGEVLRLRGVVDRFGGFQEKGRIVHTLCVRNLEHAATGQQIEPDHWWFRLRQTWTEAGIQAGDTVLFTAKVRRCTKGHHNAELLAHSTVRGREQVVGLAGDIRELVITRRCQAEFQEEYALQEELRRERLLREEAESEAMRLITHRDALLKNLDHLHRQLGAWKGRCQLLDPSLAREPVRVQQRNGGRCRGFKGMAAVC